MTGHRNPDDAPSLFGAEELPPLVKVPRGTPLSEQFAAFHRLNPWVYRQLVELTHDYLSGGRKKLGIGMLFEVMRWRRGRRTLGDEFKLNNNYRSRYARLIMATEPDLDNVFDIRELRSD